MVEYFLPGTLAAMAYHEAGYAVVALALGVKYGGASIVPDENKAAADHTIAPHHWHMVSDWKAAGCDRDDYNALRARILIYLAGRESEALFMGQAAGDGFDRHQVDWMLASLYGDNSDLIAARKRYQRHALWLVRRHERPIKRVARELLARKTLSEAALAAIVPKAKVRQTSPSKRYLEAQ